MIGQFTKESEGLVAPIGQFGSLILGTKTPSLESLAGKARFRIQNIRGSSHEHGSSPDSENLTEFFAHFDDGHAVCFKMDLEDFWEMARQVLGDGGCGLVDPM